MFEELRAIERMIDGMFEDLFSPRPKRVVAPVIIVKVRKERVPAKEKIETEESESQKGETHIVPANGSYHSEPVFGIFNTCNTREDEVQLNINGHTVYAPVDEVKKLYGAIGPALRKYKKMHPEQNEEE